MFELRKLTFTWRNSKVTVQEKSAQDLLEESPLRINILKALYPDREVKDTPVNEWNRVAVFVEMLFQTVSIQSSIIPSLPSPSASIEEIVISYRVFMRAPASLVDAWENAISAVNKEDVEANSTDPESSSGGGQREVTSNSESDAA